jgi:hypothetical protein
MKDLIQKARLESLIHKARKEGGHYRHGPVKEVMAKMRESLDILTEFVDAYCMGELEDK